MLHTAPVLVGSLSMDDIVPFLRVYIMLLFNSYVSTVLKLKQEILFHIVITSACKGNTGF